MMDESTDLHDIDAENVRSADLPPGIPAALYTTHGELKTSLPEGAPERDERVSDLYGGRNALTRDPGGTTYVAVKLTEGPRRPQTYYAAIHGDGTPSIEDVRRGIDQLVESTEFRRVSPEPDTLAGVAESLLGATPSGLEGADVEKRNVVDALSTETLLRFGTADTGYARALLDVACDAGYEAAVSLDAGSVTDDGPVVSGIDLLVGWRESDDVHLSTDTASHLEQAAQRRVERAITEELDRIEESVETLSDLGLDERTIRRRVTDRLPTVSTSEAIDADVQARDNEWRLRTRLWNRIARPTVGLGILCGLGTLGLAAALLMGIVSFPTIDRVSVPTINLLTVAISPLLWASGTVLLVAGGLLGSTLLHKRRDRQ